MNIKGHDIGVCSWSLQLPELAETIAAIKSVGLSHMQLGLLQIVMADDKRKHRMLSELRDSGIGITSGMMNFPGEDYATIADIRRTGGFCPDSLWDVRRKLMLDGSKVAKELGLSAIGVHVGFVPPSNEAGYSTMVERISDLADQMHADGVSLLMETGQESAHELLQFLNDVRRANVGVNFDPANMILYGAGDPLEAVAVLGRHIKHVHVKDATLSNTPGIEWGEEVPIRAWPSPTTRVFRCACQRGLHRSACDRA